jgi:hypothetical protein
MPTLSRELTDAEKEILGKYKRSGTLDESHFCTYELNHLLKTTPNNLIPLWISEYTHNLDKIFNISSLSNDIEVYRASEPIDKFCSNDVFSCKQYVSTARTKEVIKRHFSGIKGEAALLKIFCQQGCRAIDMEINNSHDGMEQEILLPRAIEFSITNTEVIIDRESIVLNVGFYAQ